MPPITFKTASRERTRLRLGISGPAGGGKTKGALRVARALASSWERVFVLDTEHDSASLYADLGPFQTYAMEPPFEPQRYVEAIHAAEALGAEVIVIDSLSHAWAGAGGALEMKDAASAREKGNTYTAWRHVTPHHNALVEALLQSPIDVIACLRAKMDYVQEKDANGKVTGIKKVGMAPVQREGMEYEFSAFVELDIEHWGIATKDRTEILTGRFMLTEDLGARLLAWRTARIVHTGATEQSVTPPPPPRVVTPAPRAAPPARPTVRGAALKAEWDEFCAAHGVQKQDVQAALGTEFVSEWLHAAESRSIADAKAAVRAALRPRPSTGAPDQPRLPA